MEKAWAEETVVDRVIARLSEMGYLDDQQFAAGFASARLQARPLGRRRLSRDLARRQVSNEVAAEALDRAYEEQSEEELIDRAIDARLRVRGAPRTREEAKKLFDFLLRRGFNFDLVRRRVSEISRPALSDDQDTEE
jgi:regulatory protein